ncbi:lipid kinase [Candidatus Symbiopectobacterium sp. NZEC151]|uniref:lipid kinase n=1 Tax=Candidatus Symbiopectobacterium sp. NZEC151 TaxID=2820470 RepID=UPI002226C376|nr:lipid kinase [Candidatus Symbiopectobacterium sp. NZEC151]MCW2473305.1 lipid kinase [Candidatus Symbiopectobacterium sp. NZEC151]
MTSQQEPVTALLLINEKARKGDCAREEVLAQLMAQGLRVMVPSAELSMTYSELIEHYADRVDMVIVGGGDGSLNAAAPGLVATGLPLGVLPLGTANDFARTLDIPFDLKSAISVIVAGHRRAVDLGKVNGHLFFNVSSIGFSAVLARELTAESKKRWGTLGYALAACKLLRQSRPFRAEIVHEGAVERVRTVQISVGNGRFYGGGMTVEQRAAPDDGLLDVYSLEVTHWWQMIALIPFLRRGTQGRWRQVRAFSTTELILNTRRPHDINADGELIGRTPAHFTIKQKAIEVFAPR